MVNEPFPVLLFGEYICITVKERLLNLFVHIGIQKILRSLNQRKSNKYVSLSSDCLTAWRCWSSGRMHRCHRCDPGSIPGHRKSFFFRFRFLKKATKNYLDPSY